MCGGEPAGLPGVPGWTQIPLIPGGWVLAIPMDTGWVGRGSTQPVYPPGMHPPGTQPLYTALPAPATVAIAVDVGSAVTASLGSTKEILGVRNAPHTGVSLGHRMHRLTHGPAVSLSPPVGPCCDAVTGLA